MEAEKFYRHFVTMVLYKSLKKIIVNKTSILNINICTFQTMFTFINKNGSLININLYKFSPILKKNNYITL